MGSRSIIVVIATTVAACGPSAGYRNAVAAGEQAERSGDLVTATQQYRQACAANGNEGPACTRAAELGQQVFATALTAANARCNPPGGDGPATAADTGACAAMLLPARALFPTDASLLQMVEFIGDRHVTRCRVDHPARDIDAAVRLARCAGAYRDQLDTAEHQRRVTAAYRDAAAVVAALAADAETEAQPGASWAAWSATRCLSPAGEIAARADAAWQAFLADAAVPLIVDAGTLDGRALCSRAGLAPALRCAPAVDPASPQPAIELALSVSLGALKHTVAEEQSEQRYQSGVERFENPAYPAAERRSLHAQRAFNEIEQETERWELECADANDAWNRAGNCADCGARRVRERACDNYNALVPVFNRRSNELQAARTDLEQTEPVTENIQYDTFHYVVRHHAWTLPATWQLAAAGYTGENSGTVTIRDDEHDGSSEAGVARDPLTAPSGSWYQNDLDGLLAADLAVLVKKIAADRADARAAACSEASPQWSAAWLACWAESTLWHGTLPDGAQLLRGDGGPAAPGAGALPALRCL